MLEDDFHHPKNPQDAGYLADLSWSALITQADRVDQSKPPYTLAQTEVTQGSHDQPPQTVFALQQHSPAPTEQQLPANALPTVPSAPQLPHIR